MAEYVLAYESFYRNNRGMNWSGIFRLWQKTGQAHVHHGRNRPLRLSLSDLKHVLVGLRGAPSGGASFPLEDRRLGTGKAGATQAAQTRNI